MAVVYSQCLLFIVNDASESCTRKLRSSSRRSKTTAATASSSVKGYVLCSKAFKNKRPEVLEMFEQNNFLPLSVKNVSALRLRKDVKLELIELLLDESPNACLHSVEFISDKINKEVLRLLFSRVTLSQYGAVDARPAIDAVNFKIVKRLVTSGADIQCRLDQGESLLHLALRRGPESFIRLVLEHGAEIDVQAFDGSTPLHLAVILGLPPVVRLLLEYGANVQAGMEDGLTPLHLAAWLGYAPIVQLLLRNGAAINRKNDGGFTALHMAAATGSLDVAEILLLSGADVNSRTITQKTPIIGAVLRGHIKLVEMLLKFGALVNVKDSDSISLLQAACLHHHVCVFQYLLESCFLDPKLISDIIELFLKVQNFVNVNDQAVVQNILNVDEQASFKNCSKILANHLVKITALNLPQVPNDIDVLPFWEETFPTPHSEFKTKCEKEVACMKRQTLGDTDLSFYDILAKDPPKVACVLRSNCVAQNAASDELHEKFPIYGSILLHHFQKGKELKTMLEEAIRICNFLFSHFKKLPYEIKERILGYLSTKDFLILKKACGRYNKS